MSTIRPCRWYGAVCSAVLGGVILAACDRARVDEARAEMIRVEGCLTATDDGLALTQLIRMAEPRADAAPASGNVPPPQATEIYHLVGAEDELRPHVGRQVRIVGAAEPPDVSIVRKSTPPADPRGVPADDVTGGSEVDPKVSTMQRMRFEATELRVRTVMPLDRPCGS